MCRLHAPAREDTDELTLTERATRQQAQSHKGNSKQNKLLPISPPVMEPPVTATVWPIDDVQPCSSKHIQGPNNCNNSGYSSSQQHQTQRSS